MYLGRSGLAAAAICALLLVLLPAAATQSASAAAGYNYFYASAQSQNVSRARGAKARFTVHQPSQVQLPGEHSLAEIAIRGPRSGDMVEAGWRTDATGRTRLFVYWWKNGQPQCYNGCGFVERGRGIKPGTVLEAGSAINLKWVFKRGKWKLKVNGDLAGFYPKRLWDGRFKRPKLVQVFGEVVSSSLRPCANMGNGRSAWRRGSATIRRVNFVKGPRMKLRQGVTSSDSGYSVRMLNRRALRYGGSGLC